MEARLHLVHTKSRSTYAPDPEEEEARLQKSLAEPEPHWLESFSQADSDGDGNLTVAETMAVLAEGMEEERVRAPMGA